jgi:rfaE bifunctional protein nucleotidyltransferase chain/domain
MTRDPWSKLIAPDGLTGRAHSGRVVLANGVFDILHVGHARYLQAARAAGDWLIVALNDDRSARVNRGPTRPLVPLQERLILIAALRAVDQVTWFSEPSVAATLRLIRPALHAKGTDYRPETLPLDEQQAHRELGIQVVLVGDPKTHAASDIIRTVQARYRA